MSSRAIGELKRTAEKHGIAFDHINRRYHYTARFTPDDGDLGWVLVNGTKEIFLGKNLDEALKTMETMTC